MKCFSLDKHALMETCTIIKCIGSNWRHCRKQFEIFVVFSLMWRSLGFWN